jgi:GntR family transcriptional regulator, transcriptional repressor for pyruvate dehydrogenase complex
LRWHAREGSPVKDAKVYIETLEQIRRIIREDGLVAGDKLPSERELSERLQVGRSSVREALRALEFLGIIETRRGEGTYIKDIGNHQLINLLGMFILQDKRAKADLAETKWLIEQLCLQLACQRWQEKDLAWLEKNVRQKSMNYDVFFQWVTMATHNYLLERIWRVLHNFSATISGTGSLPDVFYEKMLEALAKRDEAVVTEIWKTYVRPPLSKEK